MNNTLSGKLTSRGNLNGNVNTIVFAHNYNDLTNKPQINNVTLQGNKTASELGLATPEDITVTSVNEQTGDVVLSGSDIDYSVGMSLNAKIDDLESQIIGSGVQSVNGMTGNVTLTSNDINYSTGVTIKSKIDSVEGEIPDVYVSTVNGNSGAVILTGSNIEYSSGVSLKDKIDSVEGEIPVVDYPVTSVNTKTGDVVLDGDDIDYAEGVTVNDQIGTNTTAIGDLSQLTTTDKSSCVGAVNEVNANKADKTALTWTLLGETTGTAEQMLPSTWNELQVYGMFGGNAQYGFTAHAIKAHWGSNPAKYIEGGADKDSGTDYHIAVWHIGSNAKIGLDFWRYNNTDYTSTSKLIVYYR